MLIIIGMFCLLAYHHFSISKVSCIGNEHFVLWIDDRFLNDIDMFGSDKALSPFRNRICFAQQALRKQPSCPDFPLDGVFRQHMFARVQSPDLTKSREIL